MGKRESKLVTGWTSIERIVSSSKCIHRSAGMIVRSRTLYLDDAETVTVQVRDIQATCACGASRFYPGDSEPYGLDTELVCAGCRKQQSYLALLDRIGEEAMRRARESLAQLRRHAIAGS